MKKIFVMSRNSGGGVNLLEFDATNTTPSAGALTNVIGGDWTVVRNSVANYKPTAATSAEVAINVPRIEDGKVLIETARTNILTENIDFATSDWVKIGSPTLVHSQTAPDGSSTATKITVASETYLRQGNGSQTSGVSYGNGIWAKSAATNGATHLRLTTNNTAAWNTGMSQKLTLTSSWAYYSFTDTNISTGTSINFIIGSKNVNDGEDSDCYGDTVIWGANMELGSTASSMIITATSSVTRLADVITITVPTGATNAETWIDGVSDGGQAVTPGNTFTMLNGTTKIIMS